MGHEYMELRNTAAAVQCYRNAVDISEVPYAVDLAVCLLWVM